MAFKYINPGIADLFDEVSTNCKQNYNSDYSRTSGDCFNMTGSSTNTLFIENSVEYWSTFYYYPLKVNYSGSTIPFKFQNSSYAVALTHCYLDSSSFYLQLCDNTNKVFGDKIDRKLYYGKGYHIEFYVKDDTVNGEIKLWLDGELVYQFSGKTGQGAGFDKVAVGATSTGFETYFSDIVISNTGRIGDMRVNKIPVKLADTVCEWDSLRVPAGNNVLYYDNTTSPGRTYIMTNNQFQASGNINKVVMLLSGDTYINFFIFRKNQNTNKYNFVSVTTEYKINYTGVYTLTLTEPMNIEPGDYFGFYTSKSALRGLTNSDNDCHFFNGNSTGSSEVDYPVSSYTYNPCLFTLFKPDSLAEGVRLLDIAKQKGIQIGDYADFEVGSAEKKILMKLDTTHLKVGTIDAVSVLNVARVEGVSPATRLAAVIKSGDTVYEGDEKVLSTADKNHILGIYDKNPLTNQLWTISDLSNMQIGSISKP